MDIIIIAHKYKPYNRVGGIRWINFVENLKKKDFKIHLITVPRGGRRGGEIVKQSNNLCVYYTASDYFYKVFEELPKTRIAKYFTYGTQKLGSLIWYDDNAQFWYKQLEKVVLSILNKHPKAVIISTGAPFQACYHLMRICRKIDYDRYILDFQDPWSKNPYRKYFFEYMRRNVEKFEKTTLNHSTNNIFVTYGLKRLMEASKQNNIVIENGHSFNKQDFHYKPLIIKERLKVLYLGTLANGRDEILINFLENLKFDIKVKVNIDIYGRVSRSFEKWKGNNRNNNISIALKKLVARKEIPLIAKNYDLGLQLNSREYPYLVSTKVYEYPALGLPVISINGGGEIEALIIKNNIGISVNIDNHWEKRIGYHIKALKLVSYKDLYNFANISSWKSRTNDFVDYLNDKF